MLSRLTSSRERAGKSAGKLVAHARNAFAFSPPVSDGEPFVTEAVASRSSTFSMKRSRDRPIARARATSRASMPGFMFRFTVIPVHYFTPDTLLACFYAVRGVCHIGLGDRDQISRRIASSPSPGNPGVEKLVDRPVELFSCPWKRLNGFHPFHSSGLSRDDSLAGCIRGSGDSTERAAWRSSTSRRFG